MRKQKQKQQKKKLEAAVVMGRRGGAARMRAIGTEGFRELGRRSGFVRGEAARKKSGKAAHETDNG